MKHNCAKVARMTMLAVVALLLVCPGYASDGYILSLNNGSDLPDPTAGHSFRYESLVRSPGIFADDPLTYTDWHYEYFIYNASTESTIQSWLWYLGSSSGVLVPSPYPNRDVFGDNWPLPANGGYRLDAFDEVSQPCAYPVWSTVKWSDGHVEDVRVYIPNVAASAPSVTSVTPSSGPNTSTISITNLAGQGFADGATVRLQRSGCSDVVASNVRVQSSSSITCLFDLTGRKAGLWDVVVANPDSPPGALVQGFGISVSDSLPVVGTSIRSLLGPLMNTASLKWRFCVWGKVEPIDSSTLWLDDGSPKRVKVFAPGYSAVAGQGYAWAIGGVDVSSDQPTLVSSADRVVRAD